jgi:hypothetical protein
MNDKQTQIRRDGRNKDAKQKTMKQRWMEGRKRQKARRDVKINNVMKERERERKERNIPPTPRYLASETVIAVSQ